MQSQVSETEKSAVNRQKCIMQHATIKYLSNGNQIHKKANLRWGKIGQYARKQKDTQLCLLHNSAMRCRRKKNDGTLWFSVLFRFLCTNALCRFLLAKRQIGCCETDRRYLKWGCMATEIRSGCTLWQTIIAVFCCCCCYSRAQQKAKWCFLLLCGGLSLEIMRRIKIVVHFNVIDKQCRNDSLLYIPLNSILFHLQSAHVQRLIHSLSACIGKVFTIFASLWAVCFPLSHTKSGEAFP